MKKVAISVGDINGVGIHIALKEHSEIKKICHPIYCAHQEVFEKACDILKLKMPRDMDFFPLDQNIPDIFPSSITSQSGRYSYESFIKACELADEKKVHSICTLPINKKSWSLANISEIGHTEVLAKRYHRDTIMMLGCEKMFVALFTDHIPLKSVSSHITAEKLSAFLLNLYKNLKLKNVLVLGVNPHCGDGGIIGDEDKQINLAIKNVNEAIKKEIFIGPIPPDTAFSPINREKYRFFVSMYHDVGLAPLKALYFYDSINITLNIPIFRVSVDHGVAYDIAYKSQPNTQSYLNAINLATKNGIFYE
ncbi:4-hydroxythreonine-4-phosphate dehydrogenase [Helicobacter cappadocius]|uniref:4-hydroxythreonine-4-phosphate dehydrogenase n=1 Tax=Helicobacter cappadocius TaxID=3063998 RepID=A0AA90PRX5_9HELI|nr:MULTISPECIES: 4-hydroxythreonine-4-phosphate dehydrogenase [unclassified Helicobacter]MDO7252482.1 4-hydroxythreonine-4-phosphate dehydrogenase [Helicobacter sp. faydin-H75]MDP2538349.1 4-hydroxythreonine-4-phosphate dehydrogenase [Helicobacter sp. faydin-H76]